MKLFVLSILLVFSLYSAPADNMRRCMEAEQFFNEGNELASTNPEQAKAAWRKAVEAYEEVIENGGVANGPVFYNLGNGYFRLNDMGRAVLNYRRAFRFTPNDLNLRRNYSFAKSLCQDKVHEEEARKVMKTLFFWHYDFSLLVREWVFIIAFVIFWLLCALRLKFRRTWIGISFWTSGVLWVLMAFSMVITEWDVERHPEGVIVSEQVVGRKGNGQIYEASFQEPLHAGTEFKLLERRGEWVEVKLASGQSTWLPVNDVEMVEKEKTAQ